MSDAANDPRGPRLVLSAEPPALLREPQLFYDPPYERPVEDAFAWHLIKYLVPISGLRYQVKVPTPCLPIWLDFVVEHGVRRIGFECGALDASEEDEQAAHRAALLMASGAVDVLYRLRGVDLVHRLHDVLRVVAAWDPALFSERGRINLSTLASPTADAFRPGRTATRAHLTYTDQPLIDEADVLDAEVWPAPPKDLIVERLDAAQPAAWVRDYDAALAHYGISPDDLKVWWTQSA